MYRQAEFKRIKDNAFTIGWISVDRKLKEGMIVKLKHTIGKWKIIKIYETEVDAVNLENEYKVGGL